MDFRYTGQVSKKAQRTFVCLYRVPSYSQMLLRDQVLTFLKKQNKQKEHIEIRKERMCGQVVVFNASKWII